MIASLLLQVIATSVSSPGAPSPAAPVKATRYEYSTEAKSGGAVAMNVSGRYMATYVNDQMRIDVLSLISSKPSGGLAAGSDLLVGHGHLFTVDSAKHEYSELSGEKVKNQMADMLKALPGVELKFSDYKVDAKDLGDGQNILGHPTRRWRMHQIVNVSVIMMGDTLTMSVETTQETSHAKDLFGPGNPTVNTDSAGSTQFIDILPAEQLAKLKAAYAAMPKGILLKSTSRTTSYFGENDFSIVSSSDVSKIYPVTVSSSIFEVPKGYKLVEPLGLNSR
jgi:hypothetical protein